MENNIPSLKLRENEILEVLSHQRQLFQHTAVSQPRSDLLTTAHTPSTLTAHNPSGFQRQHQPPQQQQQQSSRRNQMYTPQSLAFSQPKTTVQEKQVDENSKSSLQSSSFPQKLFAVLEEAKYPDVLGWSPDGKSFYVNQEHPKMIDVMQKYFNLMKYKSWYRQLNIFGWTKLQKQKNKNLMYNKHFHRDMGPDDFQAIIQKKAEVMTLQKMRRKERLTEKIAKPKKPSATDSNTKEKSSKNSSTRKSKVTKATKVISKKKAAPGVSKLSLNSKKRKKPPNSPDTVDSKQARKNPSSTDDKSSDKKTAKKIREHKKLHNLFWQWDMWNFPDGLDIYMEKGKVQSYVNKKKKTTKVDAESEVNREITEDEITSLLCDEEMPDSIMNKKDDERALADLVDRIRFDMLQQEKLKELWSNTVAPVVKGKVLPPTKFAKPTDKWKKLKVGNRIGVYWRDDKLFYNALIKKQQENTSYFHLLYEDDGAEEWLDLSRESFKVLENTEKPESVVHSTPLQISRHTLDQTPRKDNRARRIKEHRDESKDLKLPESHAHLAPFVRYSWKGLGLGNRAGTPSYNSFVREKDTLSPAVTALELLNDMRVLRSHGFTGIPLQLNDEESSSDGCCENKKIDGDGITSGLLTNQLHSLKEKILKDNDAPSSMKHFNQTLNNVRKLTDNWSISTVRENLRTIETQVLKLNEREIRILEKCKQKGLC